MHSWAKDHADRFLLLPVTPRPQHEREKAAVEQNDECPRASFRRTPHLQAKWPCGTLSSLHNPFAVFDSITSLASVAAGFPQSLSFSLRRLWAEV